MKKLLRTSFALPLSVAVQIPRLVILFPQVYQRLTFRANFCVDFTLIFDWVNAFRNVLQSFAEGKLFNIANTFTMDVSSFLSTVTAQEVVRVYTEVMLAAMLANLLGTSCFCN
jgi:hypothetical protein